MVHIRIPLTTNAVLTNLFCDSKISFHDDMVVYIHGFMIFPRPVFLLHG